MPTTVAYMSALVAASYLRGVLDVLQEYDETEESTTHTITQVVAVALGTLVGAVFGTNHDIALNIVMTWEE